MRRSTDTITTTTPFTKQLVRQIRGRDNGRHWKLGTQSSHTPRTCLIAPLTWFSRCTALPGRYDARMCIIQAGQLLSRRSPRSRKYTPSVMLPPRNPACVACGRKPFCVDDVMQQEKAGTYRPAAVYPTAWVGGLMRHCGRPIDCNAPVDLSRDRLGWLSGAGVNELVALTLLLLLLLLTADQGHSRHACLCLPQDGA